jgi:MtN3 and saliva related transmembrane protein
VDDARRAGPLIRKPKESSMILQDAIGYLAASLTTASFVPQALLTLRTRDVSGISLGMYSAFTIGVALWLAYGLTIGEWPIIVANALTLALAATILAMKIVVERGRRQKR